MAGSTTSFFWPDWMSVMLEYLVRWAPVLAAVWTATTGVRVFPVSFSFAVTRPVPK